MAEKITDNARGLNSTDLLGGVTVERDEHFINYRYRLPNGGFREMTMQEVLLWEILKELRRINRDMRDISQR